MSHPNTMTELGQHCRQCAAARGRWHRLQCASELLDTFLSSRFVTTLSLVALLALALGGLAGISGLTG
jgi:hypothetical protein